MKERGGGVLRRRATLDQVVCDWGMFFFWVLRICQEPGMFMHCIPCVMNYAQCKFKRTHKQMHNEYSVNLK